MHIQVQKEHFSKIIRAISEFSLIQTGDNILIGLSGGKDSLLLTYLLKLVKERFHKNFHLAAITIDAQFSDDFPIHKLQKFCDDLQIQFYAHAVNIKELIANCDKNPCFTCAYFRRAAINNFAHKHGFNKVAYAHHHDDLTETFLLNLLQSGQLKTFLPKTYLSKTNVEVIRPLIYFREKEIIKAVETYGFTPIPSPCPYNGNTMRQEMKELVEKMTAKYPFFYDNLSAAVREDAVQALLPPLPSRQEMKIRYDNFKKI